MDSIVFSDKWTLEIPPAIAFLNPDGAVRYELRVPKGTVLTYQVERMLQEAFEYLDLTQPEGE